MMNAKLGKPENTFSKIYDKSAIIKQYITKIKYANFCLFLSKKFI